MSLALWGKKQKSAGPQVSQQVLWGSSDQSQAVEPVVLTMLFKVTWAGP